jgi:hypothetical protein
LEQLGGTLKEVFVDQTLKKEATAPSATDPCTDLVMVKWGQGLATDGTGQGSGHGRESTVLFLAYPKRLIPSRRRADTLARVYAKGDAGVSSWF